MLIMAFATHDFGDLVRVRAVFTNTATGEALDPDEVSASVRDPAGTVTTYVYGTDVELEKDEVGEYHLDIDANVSGKWYARFWSTGEGQAAQETQFTVREAHAVESE